MTVAEKVKAEVEQVDTSKTIVQLTAHNVKRLTAVSITPDADGLVIIGGDNGQGKTSVLDSIMYNLGGGTTIPSKPIREGQKTADTELILKGKDGSELVVTRTFGAKGSQVTVKGKDGAEFKKPQQILDALVGPISFDPLEFTRMNPKKQREVLLEVLGVQVDDLEAERDAAYRERTSVNRETKGLEGRADGMVFEATLEEVDTEKITEELAEAHRFNSTAVELKSTANEAQSKVIGLKIQIGNIEERIAGILEERELLQEKIDKLSEEGVDADQECAELRARCTKAEGTALTANANHEAFEPKCTDEIVSRLKQAEVVNEQFRLTQVHSQALDEVQASKKASYELTEKIKAIEDEKRSRLQSVKYPLEGLAFSDTGITFENVPLEQASGADNLKVACSLVLAMNPELRVLLIRDGSLLDNSNLGWLRDMGKKANAQIWIERVGKDDESAFIIEDGEVLSDATTNVQS